MGKGCLSKNSNVTGLVGSGWGLLPGSCPGSHRRVSQMLLTRGECYPQLSRAASVSLLWQDKARRQEEACPVLSVLWLDPGPVWIAVMGMGRRKLAHFGCFALQQRPCPVHIPWRKGSSLDEAVTAASQNERNGNGSQGHPNLFLL